MANGEDNALVSGLALPLVPPVGDLGYDPTILNTTSPIVPNRLVTPTPVPEKSGPNIVDMSGTDKLPGFGMFQSAPTGMIIHHTGGGNNIDDLVNTFQQNHLNSQFAIGKDGTIYQLLPDGTVGHHIQSGWGPQGQGRSNYNMEGVEIIADNDQDVNDAQKQAAANLVAARSQMWGWDPKTNVFGHGEVNPGHKLPDEGLTIANGIRNGTLTLPDYSQAVGRMTIQNGQLVPGARPDTVVAGGPNRLTPGTGSPTNQATLVGYNQAQPNQLAPNAPRPFDPSSIAPIPVPDNIAPYLNYWADYQGINRNIFARMINWESGFDPNRVGTAPEDKGGPEVGLGQLLKPTADYLKVKDRTDINENLRGAAQYLREALDNPRTGGDYVKALTLYNHGLNGSLDDTTYAMNVLGTGGGRKTAIGTDYASGGYYDPSQAAPVRNALAGPAQAGGPGGQGGGPMDPRTQQLVDEFQRMQQGAMQGGGQNQQDAMKRAIQMMVMQNLARQGVKFTPVSYDPMKAIAGQDREAQYRPAGGFEIGRPQKTTVSTTVPGPLQEAQGVEAVQGPPRVEPRGKLPVQVVKGQRTPVQRPPQEAPEAGTPPARRFYVRRYPIEYRTMVQ